MISSAVLKKAPPNTRRKTRLFGALKGAKEENKDYRVVFRQGSDTGSALVTPHGGGIERHVSMITAAIAGGDLDMYCFEGTMREGNAELHITSENFDEDRAIDLLKTKRTVVAIHGRADEGDADTIYLGGKDADLVAAIDEGLRAAGLKTKGSGHRFPGIKDSNIVNRGSTDKGAQLELLLSLRNRLAREPDLLERFRHAVRDAMLALDTDRRVQQQGEDPLLPVAGK